MGTKTASKVERELYKSNIWKLFLVAFFRNFSLISAILIPFFTDWAGIKFSQIMILQAFFTISIFLLEIPTGVVADRFGRKTSIVLGAFVGVLGPVIYASTKSFAVFLLAEFMFALSAALISGADSAMLYDSLKEIHEEEKSKKIFARLSSIGLISLLVSAPIGGVLAHYIGLRMTMLAFAVPLFISLLISFSLTEPKIHEHDGKNYFKILRESIAYFRRHKKLKIMVFDYIPTFVLAFFIIWIYQVILKDYNVPIFLFGFVHAFLVISQIGVLNSVGFWEKLAGGKRNYLFFSAVLVGALFLAMGLIHSIYLALISICLIAGFGITRKTLYASYFNKHIESKHRASVLSVINMLRGAGLAASDLFLGWITDMDYRISLIVAGALIILFSFASKIEEEFF